MPSKGWVAGAASTQPAPAAASSPPATSAPSPAPDAWTASIDTARFLLPAEFLRELRAAVPRRRRARASHVVAAGVLVVLVAVGTDRSVREFITTRSHGTLSLAAGATDALEQTKPANPLARAPSSILPAATTDHATEPAPVATSLPETAFASGASPSPKKAHPRRMTKKVAQ